MPLGAQLRSPLRFRFAPRAQANEAAPRWRRVRSLADALRPPSLPKRYITARKLINYWRAQAAWQFGLEHVKSKPYKLTYELTNACNLRCPHCPTGRRQDGRRKTQADLGALRRALTELGPYAFMVDLHNWGEPLLHPAACEAIRLCEDHGVMTIICTNLNVPMDEARAEELVESGLAILGVSMDGADQETYEVYRVGGRLERVVENIRFIQEAKERLGSETPRLVCSYLVFRHNEDRVEEARELVTGLGMEFCASRGLTDDPDWQASGIYLHPQDDVARHGAGCQWLYSMAVVNADEGISPCCTAAAFSSQDDFGTMASGPFAQSWNNSRFRAARRLFSRREESPEPADPELCCLSCPVYLERHAD